MPCVNPKMTEIIARGRCILRNLWRSFLRNRPTRKVVKTKQSVAIPRGRTRENNEKELWSWSSWPVWSSAKAFPLKASPQKINANKNINTYGFISVTLFLSKPNETLNHFSTVSLLINGSAIDGSSVPTSISSSASFC